MSKFSLFRFVVGLDVYLIPVLQSPGLLRVFPRCGCVGLHLVASISFQRSPNRSLCLASVSIFLFALSNQLYRVYEMGKVSSALMLRLPRLLPWRQLWYEGSIFVELQFKSRQS